MDMSKFGGDQYLKVEDAPASDLCGHDRGNRGRGYSTGRSRSLSNGSTVQLNVTNTRALIRRGVRNSTDWLESRDRADDRPG